MLLADYCQLSEHHQMHQHSARSANLPRPYTVQLGCSSVQILQSCGLGPGQGKYTNTMTLDPFICEAFQKSKYLNPERSLGRKICQTQLNSWIFWPEVLSSKKSVIVRDPDWVRCDLSFRGVPHYHFCSLILIIEHINDFDLCCVKITMLWIRCPL